MGLACDGFFLKFQQHYRNASEVNFLIDLREIEYVDFISATAVRTNTIMHVFNNCMHINDMQLFERESL